MKNLKITNQNLYLTPYLPLSTFVERGTEGGEVYQFCLLFFRF